jgi:hypothetical protein
VKLVPFLREDVRPPEGREQVRFPKDVLPSESFTSGGKGDLRVLRLLRFLRKAGNVRLEEGRASFGEPSKVTRSLSETSPSFRKKRRTPLLREEERAGRLQRTHSARFPLNDVRPPTYLYVPIRTYTLPNVTKRYHTLPEGSEVSALPEGSEVSALPEGSEVSALPEGREVSAFPEGRGGRMGTEGHGRK